MIKSLIRQITPPILLSMARRLKSVVSPFYGVSGEFSSWQNALDYCAMHKHQSGYEAINIIDKVAAAIQEVRKGNAEFERDSVLFYEKDYNYQFLSALFLSISGCGERHPLHIVDFGGSLGSTFFQNRSLLNSMKYPPVWNVIEQKHFVDRGRREVPEIHFYYTINEFVEKGGQCDVLIFSAVIDYLEKPYPFLEELLKYSWKYVLIDRSFYHPLNNEIISIQTVPTVIYDAQYPLWLRSKDKQQSFFEEKGYHLIHEWDSPFSMPYMERGKKTRVPLKGFLFKNGKI